MGLHVKVILTAILPFLLAFFIGAMNINTFFKRQQASLYKNIDLKSKIVYERVEDHINIMKIMVNNFANSNENLSAVFLKDNDHLFKIIKNYLTPFIQKSFVLSADGLVLARGHDEYFFGDFFKTIPTEKNELFGIYDVEGKDSFVYGKKLYYKSQYVGSIFLLIPITKELLQDFAKDSDSVLTYSSATTTYPLSSKLIDDTVLKNYKLNLHLDSSSLQNIDFDLTFYASEEIIDLMKIGKQIYLPLLFAFLIIPFVVFGVLFFHLKPYTSLIDLLKKFSQKEISLKELYIQCKKFSYQKHHEIKNISRALEGMIEATEKSLDELERISITDTLTRVYNRFKMEKVLTREIKKSLRKQTIFSVIILDIDFFKSINDTYGHMIGDKVLKQVAQKIQANIRDTDWVGRWGGEEFMIVCEHTNEQEAYLLADKMRKIINSEKIEETNVTVSLGVSQYNQNDTNWDQVVTRADDALYLAKNSGRDSVKIFRSQNV